MALAELHGVLDVVRHSHPDAAFIVAVDFNKANLQKVMPNFYQHVTCTTRGANILEQCYSPYRKGYKAVLKPAFGRSAHNTILLIPEYKQKFLREPPIGRKVPRWNDQSEATLQSALDDMDWEAFKHDMGNSSFTDVVRLMKSFPQSLPKLS